MSTTVTYKGSTLTTVNNQTRVLETAGTWLEDDITLTDVTQGGITPTGTKQINISQNGTVTEDVTNYASAQITVNVSGGGTPSQTQHTIYFEFSDNTNTTITAYWDGTFISDAVRATTPTTYNNKTVTLAQLDGVTWYGPAQIPLNTQLINYNSLTNNKSIDATGNLENNEWYSVSDYTEIDPTMTFTYRCNLWFYVGFYDATKSAISAMAVYGNATPDADNDQVGVGTLNSSNIPASAKYVRLTSVSHPDSTELSLIRTA